MTLGIDLATGVAASFLYEGIKRCQGGLSFALDRRHKIDRALTSKLPIDRKALSKSPADPKVLKAIEDLALVIGNSQGKFDENVAKFLREIEKSALPEAMLRAILSESDMTVLYPAFEILHRSFDNNLPFEARPFFDALTAAIRLRAELELKDNKGLYDFMAAQNKKLELYLQLLLGALSNQTPAQLLSFDELNELRLKIARSIENSNRSLSVETQQGTKRVNIRSLVVPARLRPTLVDEGKRQPLHSTDEVSMSFIHFKECAGRVVILGDPGGGKSTLSQMLCYDLASAISLDDDHFDQDGIDPSTLKLPLKIVLRAFEKRQKNDPSYDFLNYLVDDLKTVLDGNVELTRNLLTQLLNIGSAFLLFDGLDEVLDVNSRRHIVECIEKFVSVYAACPAMVTSRFVGYRDAPMSDEYLLLELARFNIEEIKTFAYRLIKIVNKDKKEQAEAAAEKFIAQTQNIGRDIRENPLMLGLMVYLFIYRGEVPAFKPEIYKECATLMFERWDQRRDIIVETPGDIDLLDVFAFLASRIFGSAETEDGVSKDWLLDALKIFFENWYLDKPKALRAARSLVGFITGRAWVMSEVGPTVFKFTHRTFLEYFFARHLNSISVSISALIRDKLLERVIRSEWDVIVHLALHSADYRDAGKMVQAAETLLEILRTGTFDLQGQGAYLTFCSQSLEYLLLPEVKYVEISNEIFERIIGFGTKNTPRATSILNILLENTAKRVGLVQPQFSDIIKKNMNRVGSAERQFVSFACVELSVSSLSVRHMNIGFRHRYMASAIGIYFRPTVETMEAANFARAKENANDALLYVMLYRKRRTELLRIHGFACLFGNVQFQKPDEVFCVIFDIISEAISSRFAKSSSAENSDIVEVVIYLSNLVQERNRGRPVSQVSKIYGSIDADDVVRDIYVFIFEGRSTAEALTVAVRCLILFAYFHDLNCSLPSGRKYAGNIRREPRNIQASRNNVVELKAKLEYFMPDEPMVKMLKACRKVPLIDVVNDWNRGVINLCPTE